MDALSAEAFVLLDSGDGSGDSMVLLPTGPRLLDDGAAVTLDGEVWTAHHDDPFAAIDALCSRFGLGPGASGGPVGACLAGVLSYDLARRVESLDPPSTEARALDDRGLPLLDLALCEVAIVVDAAGGTRVVVDDRGGAGVAEAERVAARALDRLGHGAVGRVVPATVDVATDDAPRAVVGPRSTTSREAYLDDVRRVLDHVAAGDTFQVNLSHRLTSRWRGDATALYRSLRDASPARYGAVARLGAATVASISPETFLVARGRDVMTRPIKGTRPRGATPAQDTALADDLVASPKDHAENVMVVDMERNDLGRVCEPGSVRVPRLLDLEAHPTVWHLVSEVVGTLREDVGWGGLLRATFPCGSVTGTPKVRAMQVIEALEPVRRHAYCGAIGLLGDGRLDLSVAIRTATLMPDGTVDYGAGGGVVADSDPADEHAETLAKAAAFLTALDSEQR